MLNGLTASVLSRRNWFDPWCVQLLCGKMRPLSLFQMEKAPVSSKTLTSLDKNGCCYSDWPSLFDETELKRSCIMQWLCLKLDVTLRRTCCFLHVLLSKSKGQIIILVAVRLYEMADDVHMLAWYVPSTGSRSPTSGQVKEARTDIRQPIESSSCLHNSQRG